MLSETDLVVGDRVMNGAGRVGTLLEIRAGYLVVHLDGDRYSSCVLTDYIAKEQE